MTKAEAVKTLEETIQKIHQGGIWVTGAIELQNVPVGYVIGQENCNGRIGYFLKPKKASKGLIQVENGNKITQPVTQTTQQGDAPPMSKMWRYHASNWHLLHLR